MSSKKKHHSNRPHPAHDLHASAQHETPTGSHPSRAAAVAAPIQNNGGRLLLLAVLVVGAFFGAYRFAVASTTGPAPLVPGLVAGGDGCCGSGGGGAPIEGTATVEGDVQKISVDLSTGSYNPNVIKLKAGVPTEITFGQSGGCTSVVVSSDLGFKEDLTAGPKTVKLQGLAAGTYSFACGMNMVTGQIVVE